jgi:large subunit ribosomal protein L28
MAYICQICGKGKQFGQNKPHSQKRTKRVWNPNLQIQHFEIDGQKVKMKVCTQCLRTLKKASAGKAAPTPAKA